jgi:hypothetical protein
VVKKSNIMTTQNYKQTILNAYRDSELSQADFSNTVDHFEKLVRGEYKEEPTELIEGGKYVYTGERIQSLNTEDVFLKTNSIVVYARVLNGFSSVKDKEGLKWIIKNSDLAPLPNPTDMKSKLNAGFTVVYRDESERTVKGDGLYLGCEQFNGLRHYNDELNNHGSSRDNDIISIRNTNNVEIWKRVNEVWVEVEQEDAEKINFIDQNRVNLAAQLIVDGIATLSSYEEPFRTKIAGQVEQIKSTPIELLPQNLHKEKVDSERVIEIAQAIIRFREAGKQVPSEWITELNELTK